MNVAQDAWYAIEFPYRCSMPWLPFHTLTSSWLIYFPGSLWLWHRSLRNGWLLTSPCLSISELCGAWFAEVFGSVESGWKRCTTRVDVDSFEKFLKFGKKHCHGVTFGWLGFPKNFEWPGSNWFYFAAALLQGARYMLADGGSWKGGMKLFQWKWSVLVFCFGNLVTPGLRWDDPATR